MYQPPLDHLPLRPSQHRRAETSRTRDHSQRADSRHTSRVSEAGVAVVVGLAPKKRRK